MKVVEMYQVDEKTWEKAINTYEVITITRNEHNHTLTADLFTKCKKANTAVRRFFKGLENYASFNEYRERIEESIAFSIESGITYYYISVTVPMEEEQEEQTEAKEENTNMEDIKIKTSWTKANRNEDGSLTESCKKYIYMDIDITGATEQEADLILNKLVDTINKNCYCDRAGCIGIEENKKGELIYYDMLFFDKETGNVAQQRRELMVLVNSLKKEIIKEVLKKEQKSEQEEQEQEQTEIDKNKKQILKQWKALAEADLSSKELNEQAKEFYTLFKSVLIENKTQLNGNEYKNIISSLRAYGDTKPAKDKDIIVIELLNLNKSSIVLEPGSIEPLDMFLGNVLGWFKRYYTITEEQEEIAETEQPEAKKESINIKDIKIRTSWSKILKDEENGWHEIDKTNIVLDVDMEGVTWDLGCDIMDALENRINEEGFYSCTRGGCPDFDEERSIFCDCLFFERDYGSIKEQRKEAIKYVNSIKKEVIRKVLEQEAR